MKVVRTRRGVRIVQRGLVLSEIVDEPGPTDSLFDVLAAAIAALSPGPRVAVLGFAGGGIIAPMRAMGFGHPVEAVDLSLDGERLFRKHAGPWAGEVNVHEYEASRWLRSSRRRWDMILEDLSVETAIHVAKPSISLGALPDLMKRRLADRGVVAVNLLPVPGMPWRELLDRVARPWKRTKTQVVLLDEYENRILLAGRLASARTTSQALKRHLRALGSDQADGLSVRSRRPS